MNLPDNSTLRWLSLFGAGVVISGFLAGLILVVWLGFDLPAEQLRILGWACFGFLALLAVVLVALAAVNVKASAGVASLEIDGDGK